jgi:hypothetical protein
MKKIQPNDTVKRDPPPDLEQVKALCHRFINGSMNKTAKNAVGLLSVFGILPSDSIRSNVLREFASNGIRSECTATRVRFYLVEANHTRPFLFVANKWIEAAKVISNRVKDSNVTQENLITPEIQKLLSSIKETEKWVVFSPKTKQGGSNKKTIKNDGEKLNKERIRYSKTHHSWIFSWQGKLLRFDNKDAAIQAYCRYYHSHPPPDKTPPGCSQELPSKSVWAGEWNQINRTHK